MFKKLADCE